VDVFKYNSAAWDNEVLIGNSWTKAVSADQVANAKNGNYNIFLSPVKAVPSSWLNSISGKKILCLASGGGQQGPLLAAAGAIVTVFDASKNQLEQDQFVAQRDGLQIDTVLGDMKDLRCFADHSFDFIINPPSNCFVPDVKPVWKECYRILKAGGQLLSGFGNPITYSFDRSLIAQGILQLKYALPYSDLISLTDIERKEFIDRNEPLEFGHTLEDQIAGQINIGFMITGFYEDKWGNGNIEDQYFSHFIVTRAIKV